MASTEALTIYLHDRTDQFRFQLQGPLAGNWVNELETCWQTARSLGDRAYWIDLSGLTGIDQAGRRLLARMHERGARLVAATRYGRQLLEEITGWQDQGVVEERSAASWHQRLRQRRWNLMVLAKRTGSRMLS